MILCVCDDTLCVDVFSALVCMCLCVCIYMCARVCICGMISSGVHGSTPKVSACLQCFVCLCICSSAVPLSMWLKLITFQNMFVLTPLDISLRSLLRVYYHCYSYCYYYCYFLVYNSHYITMYVHVFTSLPIDIYLRSLVRVYCYCYSYCCSWYISSL